MRVNRMHANMIVQNIISYHQSFEEGIRQQNRLQTEYGRRILYILWLCCMQCMVKDADHVSRLIRLVVWELGGGGGGGVCEGCSYCTSQVMEGHMIYRMRLRAAECVSTSCRHIYRVGKGVPV